MEGSVPQGVARYRDPTGPFIMTRIPKSGPIIMTLTAQEWGNIVTPDILEGRGSAVTEDGKYISQQSYL